MRGLFLISYIVHYAKFRGETMLFNEAIELWRESLIISLRSAKTIESHIFCMNYLNRFLEEKYNSMIYLDEVKTEDIENFFKFLRITKENSLNTIETYKRKIKTFYNFLIKKEIVKYNITEPIPKIKTVPKPRVYLNFKEASKIVNEIESPVVQVFYQVLYYTGLRKSEALNLSIDDVDLKENFIFVKNGKGGKNRRVPISKKLKKILGNYLENTKVSKINSFFATPKSGNLSSQYLERRLKEALKRLKLEKKGITTHTFRHSFASNLVKKKVNLKVIQKLLGHSDITVTAIYLNADMDDMQKAVEEL